MSKPKKDQNIEIPDHLLKQLLTASKLRMLKNKWHIIKLLEEGLSIRKIAKQVKVGTDTVVRAARMLEKNDLRKALDKKTERQFKSQTPWIFGKNI